MADGKSGSGASDQHPYVEQIRPDPSKPPKAVVTLTGLLGRSDRDGHQRIYFTRDLTTYAEFLASDVLFVEPVPAADSPIQGIDASRVTLSQDATVHYTRSTKAAALGDFDLDVRTAAAPAAVGALALPVSRGAICTEATCATDCRRTCDTCQTQCDQNTCNTCHTCQTQCGQATCQTCQTQCGQNTCHTCAGQATCQTCQTCQTQCGQATCQTCQTDCRGRTCVTCDTCNPHVFTCGPNPQCRF